MAFGVQPEQIRLLRRGQCTAREYAGVRLLVPRCRPRLKSPGDRLRRNVGTKVSGLDAKAQVLTQFGINLTNPADGRLDRLGHGQTRAFGM